MTISELLFLRCFVLMQQRLTGSDQGEGFGREAGYLTWRKSDTSHREAELDAPRRHRGPRNLISDGAARHSISKRNESLFLEFSKPELEFEFERTI